VIATLADLFSLRGIPGHIRSDSGSDFIAAAVKNWIAAARARTAFIAKSNPWENGHIQSFNGKLRDEFLNGEIFCSLREAQLAIEQWRHYTRPARTHR
jgi:putative transposase